jgi:hypothetical protein
MQTQLEAIVQRYTDKPHLLGGVVIEESRDKSLSFASDASEQKQLFVEDQIHVEQLDGREAGVLDEDAENNSTSQNRFYFDRVASEGEDGPGSDRK